MNIHDFSTNVSDYGFSVDKKNTVKALRDLANSIESSDVCVQSVRITSLAKGDDYPYTSLRMVFAEKRRKPDGGIKELKGGSRFPVDVVQTQRTDAVGTNGCKAKVNIKQ